MPFQLTIRMDNNGSLLDPLLDHQPTGIVRFALKPMAMEDCATERRTGTFSLAAAPAFERRSRCNESASNGTSRRGHADQPRSAVHCRSKSNTHSSPVLAHADKWM